MFRGLVFPNPGTLAGCILAAAIGPWAGGAAAADIGRGGALYGTHCATCHGQRGTPVMPGTPDLRQGRGLLKSDAQLLGTLRNGKGAMPGYLGILKDKEMLDVMAYLRTLI